MKCASPMKYCLRSVKYALRRVDLFHFTESDSFQFHNLRSKLFHIERKRDISFCSILSINFLSGCIHSQPFRLLHHQKSIILFQQFCRFRYIVMTTRKTGGMHLAYKAILLAAPQGAPKRFANRITFTGCPTSGAVFYLPFLTCSPVNGSIYSCILI